MLKRYSIAKLPEYLIFCIKRFSKNAFVSEKNPTIVNFPVKNMDMSECRLKSVMFALWTTFYKNCLDLSFDNADLSTKYDLMANIIYEGTEKLDTGVFKVEVVHSANEQWFQIHDLFVETIMAQMLILSESYIQIWKRQPI